MILHENRLPANDSHEIPYLICYFLKSGKTFNCRLLQIIGGALKVKHYIEHLLLQCHVKTEGVYCNVASVSLTVKCVLQYIMHFGGTETNI